MTSEGTTFVGVFFYVPREIFPNFGIIYLEGYLPLNIWTHSTNCHNYNSQFCYYRKLDTHIFNILEFKISLCTHPSIASPQLSICHLADQLIRNVVIKMAHIILIRFSPPQPAPFSKESDIKMYIIIIRFFFPPILQLYNP